MAGRSIYIRLTGAQLGVLAAMADECLRTPQEQAAYLVTQGLLRWRAGKEFEASLERDANLEVA